MKPRKTFQLNQTGSGKHATAVDKYKGMPANRRAILEKMDRDGEGSALNHHVAMTKPAKSLTRSNSLYRREEAAPVKTLTKKEIAHAY